MSSTGSKTWVGFIGFVLLLSFIPGAQGQIRIPPEINPNNHTVTKTFAIPIKGTFNSGVVVVKQDFPTDNILQILPETLVVPRSLQQPKLTLVPPHSILITFTLGGDAGKALDTECTVTGVTSIPQPEHLSGRGRR